MKAKNTQNWFYSCYITLTRARFIINITNHLPLTDVDFREKYTELYKMTGQTKEKSNSSAVVMGGGGRGSPDTPILIN